MTMRNKLGPNKATTGRGLSIGRAGKTAIAILGIGFITGTAVVIGLDKIMKKIFVNEEWPEEEWSNEDWSDADLKA